MTQNDIDGTCTTCEQRHVTAEGYPACPAHITQGDRRGEPCRNEAGKGTNHVGVGQCRKHGGNTSSANKNALRIQVEDEVRSQLGLTEWEPIVDPFSALADHAGKGAAIEEILRLKVEELSSLKQYGGEMGDRISVIFEAWERAYARLSSNLQAMARLSLEDRIASVQAKTDEATAALIQTALAGALDVVPLTVEDKDLILRQLGVLLRVAEATPHDRSLQKST